MRQLTILVAVICAVLCLAGCELGCDHDLSFEPSEGDAGPGETLDTPDAAPEAGPETAEPTPPVVPPSPEDPFFSRPAPFALPEGFEVETTDNAVVVVVPERSTFGALYRDEVSGMVAYVFMNGPQGRTMSGFYTARFPERLEVAVTDIESGGSEVLVNLPAYVMADFVVTLHRILEPSSTNRSEPNGGMISI